MNRVPIIYAARGDALAAGGKEAAYFTTGAPGMMGMGTIIGMGVP